MSPDILRLLTSSSIDQFGQRLEMTKAEQEEEENEDEENNSINDKK